MALTDVQKRKLIQKALRNFRVELRKAQTILSAAHDRTSALIARHTRIDPGEIETVIQTMVDVDGQLNKCVPPLNDAESVASS
jgi:hypothetical protein